MNGYFVKKITSLILLSLGAMIALMPAGAAFAAGVTTSITVISVPNAPSGLSANATAYNQAVLTWTDNSGNEDGFSVERKTDIGGTYGVIGTTGSNIATYTDNTVSGDTTYYYQVRAFVGNNGTYSTYSNEASTTTPAAPIAPSPSPATSIIGVGAGGSPPVFQTSATFKGIAYPSSQITLLENGQIVASTRAGADAQFEFDLDEVAPGTYNFTVFAVDPAGNYTNPQTFQISITEGAATVISGIFFAPTIQADKVQVKRGDSVTVSGYSAPQATVAVILHSLSKVITANVTSSASGVWTDTLATSQLALGNYAVSARAFANGDTSVDSSLIEFTVSKNNVTTPPKTGNVPLKGDFNGDGKVNLVDFSIMAYWYGRQNPPAKIDLNNDGKIDLVDFSILIYYWTG